MAGWDSQEHRSKPVAPPNRSFQNSDGSGYHMWRSRWWPQDLGGSSREKRIKEHGREIFVAPGEQPMRSTGSEADGNDGGGDDDTHPLHVVVLIGIPGAGIARRDTHACGPLECRESIE